MAEEDVAFAPVAIRCALMEPLFVHDDDGVHEYRAVSCTRTGPTTVVAVYEEVAPAGTPPTCPLTGRRPGPMESTRLPSCPLRGPGPLCKAHLASGA